MWEFVSSYIISRTSYLWWHDYDFSIVLDPIYRFNPATFLCLSQARTWIFNVICHGNFCVQWVQIKWEMIVRFVDIGGIDDHHCLNFLLITTHFSLISKVQWNNRLQVDMLLHIILTLSLYWPWAYQSLFLFVHIEK